MNPIPIPAPASPEVDSPAPIFCAACSNIKCIREELYLFIFKNLILGRFK
jgi:hypothetical protein